ncbi:MAG: S8 family serine peptidase [Rhodothermales bacterium]
MPSFSLSTPTRHLAVLLLATVLLAACDLADPVLDDARPPSAEPLAAASAPQGASKLRHSHLLDRAKRTGEAARGGEAEGYIGLIVGLDPYRIIERYGEIDPYRIIERYQDMDPYRIIERYQYSDVFAGFAIWVDEDEADALLNDMAADDEIAWVEPDIKILATPLGNMTYSEGGAEMTPWGVARIGGGGLDGSGVDLFVIDTGIDSGDVTTGPGFDFVHEANASGQDLDGHGTHIAGTAAALVNGQGSVGIAPGTTIHDLRVLTGHEVDDNESPVDLSRAIAAVEHVTAYKLANPNRPVVVNFSLGAEIGTTAYNALDEAIVASTAVGVVYVVAAGNDGIDASTVTPAHVAEAITVGAYGQDDRFASFSNYGARLDILAPGVDIVSTAPSSTGLAVMSGTSMAAAHVSGAAAAFLAANPTATPDRVAQSIVGTAQPGIAGVPAGTASASVYAGPRGLMSASVPPFFQYALTAGDDVKVLSGNLSVRVGGSGAPNASVFANDRLHLPLRGSEFEGFGYYGTSADRPYSFRPAYNPSGLPTTMAQPPIDVPAFRAQDYAHLATASTGTYHLAGRLQMGTAEQPSILYVNGDLVVSGPAHFTGYGIVLVTGNVYVNSRITSPTDGSTRLGIYANGDITVTAASSNVAAQVFSAGDIILRAPTTIYGSVTAGDDVQVETAGAVVHYRTASPALTEPFWPMAGQH